MIIADTSIWIEHFRHGHDKLTQLLENDQLLMHTAVIGELALGSIRQRKIILDALKDLPESIPADDNEVLTFIEQNKLYGLGIGYVDAHLLASARLTNARLWTNDKRLNEVAKQLGFAYIPQ